MSVLAYKYSVNPLTLGGVVDIGSGFLDQTLILTF